jgi:uncharacterized protein YqeY
MIQTDIKERIKDAMRAKDAVQLGVLRGLTTAFTNELVASKRKPDEVLSDEEALDVIRRSVKQRKDSIEQFEKGGRSDLAESEKVELTILEAFLPPQMSPEEIQAFVASKHAELQMDKSKSGQFMGIVMKDLKGKADSALVKQAIDSLF